MQFIWKILPPRDDSQPHGQEALAAALEKGQDIKEHQENLKAYLDKLKQSTLNEKERADFTKQLEQWDLSGNVEAIRRAGIEEQKNLEDPLKRHILLASEFLTPLETNDKLTFKVNFKDNQLAYWKVGAADMLPPNITAISVKKEDGSVVSERAVRRLNPNSGRIGYYDAKLLEQGLYEYVPVFSGDEITILETGEMPRDNSVQSMREHMEIYRNDRPGAMSASVNEPIERLYTPQTRTVNPDVSTAIKAERSAVTGGTHGELALMRAELSSEAVQSPETAEMRRRLVDVAMSYLAKDKGVKFHEQLYSKENNAYQKGKLGCAITASTILTEARNINFTHAAVNGVEPHLREKGWSSVSYAPGVERPGDVIVWRSKTGPWPNAPETGGHIGIIVGPNQVVHNARVQEDYKGKSTFLARPRLTAIKQYGNPPYGTITLWRQPEYRATTDQLQTAQNRAPSPSARPQESPQPTAGNIFNRKTTNSKLITADHRQNLQNLAMRPGKEKEVRGFVEKAMANKARYERVARATGIPWELIAAIHYRESSMSFTTYLHNGQPLGAPTTYVPEGILFGKGQWEKAAIHALGGNIVDNNGRPSLQDFQQLRHQVGLTADSKDPGAMLTFAERYNGLGNRNRGRTSSYVYAGTNMDQGGMFVADRVFDPNKIDPRIGVAAMVAALSETEGTPIVTRKGERFV